MTINDRMPYDIILQPAAGTDTTNILPAYHDPLSTDPVKRIRVPVGISVAMISNDSPFTITLLMYRNGRELQVAEVSPWGVASAQLITEQSDTEMWVMLSGVSQVGHRIANRVGIKIIPTDTGVGA